MSGHITHQAPRTRDVDWAEVSRRQQARMQNDERAVVFVVKNVRPDGRDESKAPMVFVAPKSHIMAALSQRYGRRYMGEPARLDSLAPWGTPVYQILVMSAPSKDYITNVVGWDDLDAWVLSYVAQDEQPEPLCSIKYMQDRLIVQLDRLSTLM